MTNGEAFTHHESRKESVHGIEIRQPQEDLTWERLQAASGIARVVLEEERAQSVGETRAESLGHRMGKLDPLTCGETDPWCFRQRDQREQVARIVLAVAIQGHDQRRVRGPHTREDRGTFPATLLMRGVANESVVTDQCLQNERRAVGAAIIHDKNLETLAGENRRDFLYDCGEILRFVFSRDDDRKSKGLAHTLAQGDAV